MAKATENQLEGLIPDWLNLTSAQMLEKLKHHFGALGAGMLHDSLYIVFVEFGKSLCFLRVVHCICLCHGCKLIAGPQTIGSQERCNQLMTL